MSGAPTRAFGAGLGLLLCMLASSCGGGDNLLSSGSKSNTPPPSGANVVSAVVNAGPANNSANTLFVSVTVCVPGSTTNCQTIDDVEVDTASYGLRLLSSALTLALPVQTLSSGASLLECTDFVQGYSWGPVVAADVKIGGETASSLPVQVIGDPNYSTVPVDCSGLGTAVDTVTLFGANGVLGVGPFVQDCGAGCANVAEAGTYYACTASGQCVATAVATTAQVQNPVSAFAKDNNGVIVQLPSVDGSGAVSATGTLIFGVGTESNNAPSAGQTVLTVDNSDYLTVTFNGVSYPTSFIDSGSNGIFFNDSNLPVCTQTNLTAFYCPSAPVSLSATLTGANGVTATADFTIANTATLLSTSTDLTALPELGGTFPGSSTSFDFGLPFFFGRNVASVIEGNTTTAGTGPYFAF